jgi:hypothetical protein
MRGAADESRQERNKGQLRRRERDKEKAFREK